MGRAEATGRQNECPGWEGVELLELLRGSKRLRLMGQLMATYTVFSYITASDFLYVHAIICRVRVVFKIAVMFFLESDSMYKAAAYLQSPKDTRCHTPAPTRLVYWANTRLQPDHHVPINTEGRHEASLDRPLSHLLPTPPR